MDTCTVIDEKRFRVLMETWVEWSRSDRWVEGYADSCTVVASNRSRVFEELCDDVDRWVGEVIDSEVNDLPPNERIAVHHVWLLSVWRLREPLEVVYGRAKDRLIEKLEARGIE